MTATFTDGRFTLKRKCKVDGCEATVILTRLKEDDWLVSHGGGEAAQIYDFRSLFVTTGYQAWAREVHAYQAAS